MTRHPKFSLIVPAAALLLAVGHAPARADLVTSTTSSAAPLSGGGFLFTFTVTDLASSTLPVSEFDVNVGPFANLGGLTAADGVTPTNSAGFLPLFTPGDPFVQFLSPDPSADIKPGSSAVFTFTSLVGPASAADTVVGLDATGAPVQNVGTVAFAPTAVPEPATVVLLGVALAALPFLHSRTGRTRSRG